MNSKFQRLGRRNKKAVLNEQFKKKKKAKIEENNRMGKTRYLFKKIRETKGIFHKTWAQ